MLRFDEKLLNIQTKTFDPAEVMDSFILLVHTDNCFEVNLLNGLYLMFEFSEGLGVRNYRWCF